VKHGPRRALLALLACLGPLASAENTLYPADLLFAGVNPVSARNRALGGPRATDPDGLYTLFGNPGLLQMAEDARLFEIALGAFGDFADIVPFIGKSLEAAFFDSLTGEAFPAGFEARGPLTIGLVSKGFGAGLFLRTATESQTAGGRARANLDIDVIGSAGYAFRLVDNADLNVDFGLAGKLFARQVMDFYDEPAADNGAAARDMNPKLLIGAGLDLGVLVSVQDTFLLGFSVNDAATAAMARAVGDAEVPPYLLRQPDAGFGLGLRGIEAANLVWTFTVDMHDLLGLALNIGAEAALLRLAVGLEVTFFRVVSLRFGFASLLPGGGLGINFGKVAIDLAAYGKETGGIPGERAVPAFDAAILCRF